MDGELLYLHLGMGAVMGAEANRRREAKKNRISQLTA
jgi:hypothetical protein